ncbi:MAG TPA: SDR family oxidoreductase [Acidimicrobiales bacterium]|nr:SDR family oxidoreductase [Acidimicrobiales bacterium]
MDLRLDGRLALVTGAASGIGAATARRLAAEGALVVVADRDRAGAADVADEIGGHPVGLDVTDPLVVRTAFAEVAGLLGPIDVLVNNAGGGQLALFIDTDEDDWDRLVALNLRGTMSCTRAVLRSMYERRRGAIVNVASESGNVGAPGGAAYSAAKAGVIGFTKAVARESARYGVRVNAVAPGPIETPLLHAPEFSTPLGVKVKEQLVAATVLGRAGTPEEVAAAIAYLASGDASYVTGQTLAVSGGVSM